ncbi:MAG TPA: class I SAM-dependent methyltransferase [Ktedonobacteraceae bacterium]
MSKEPDTTTANPPHIHHPRFAAYFERAGRGKSEREFIEPLRRKLLAQAHGIVLEVGAGTGLNFPLYQPDKVEKIEATEPDSSMISYAQERISLAHVPLTLTQADVETLPFADKSFDCVVATLVFCSVGDPARGLQEIRRVLKPGGTLLLLEHVRAQGRFASRMQDLLVPLTTRLLGNCHWNRATSQAVSEAGFQIDRELLTSGWLLPVIRLQATRPL